jgi:hypothetical protein
LQADAYQHTGCYNVKCPGFVQINKNVVIGGTLSPNSVYNGAQINLNISIVKVNSLHFFQKYFYN